MRYEWLLFDLDGTLFDYDDAEKTALSRAFRQHGVDFSDDILQTYRDVNKKIWLDFENGRISQQEIKSERFRILADTLGITIDPVRFSDDYLQFLSENTTLIEHAGSVLEQLRNGYKMALVTNGLKQVQRPRIAASSIKDYFTAIIISEEIGFAKPDPRFFDVAFDQIGNPSRNSVLLIGDSLTSDMTGGNRYRIDTCWYNPARSEPAPEMEITYEIGSLTELLSFLDRNSSHTDTFS